MPILENGTNMPLAPQAFGETAPQFWPSYYVPRLGMSLETAFASYGQLYRTQPWVYAAVRKVSRSISRLGASVWDTTPGTPEAGQSLDVRSAFAKLIADPCPTMSSSAFWDWTIATIEVYGETYWIKLRDDDSGRVTGLVPMHPSLTQIFRDVDGTESYRFMGRPSQVFSRDDVVPFREFNPDNTMRGVSRLEPLRSTLLNEDSARRSMASTWKNGTNPTGIVTSERELGTLGRERLKMAFQSEHQGTGNHGRVVVLEDGVTFTQMPSKAIDMAYLEARELNREEVAGVFDLPPSALQIMDHATFSNITENMRSLYRDSLAPRIEFAESVINWEVGKEFSRSKTFKFNVAEVLRGAFEQRAEALAKLVMSGVFKPSEARQYFDLGYAGPESDRLYANQAMQPLGQPVAGSPSDDANAEKQLPELPAEPDDDDAATKAAITSRVRELSGLIGRGRTIQAGARELIDKTGDTDGVRAACEVLLERRIN